MLPNVRTERHGRIAVIVLDRPERKNALIDEMISDIRASIAEIAGDPSVGGLMITGVDGAFCAGADLDSAVSSAASADLDTREYIEEQGQGIVKDLVGIDVPTVAAIDGPAIGMGFDLALACDQLVFGPLGWGMQGWGRVGLIDGTGGTLLLRRRNPDVLWRLLADQPRIDGALAEQWNLGENAGDRRAREAGLELLESYDHLPIAALRHYVAEQRRELREALPGYLRRAAIVQADLITSPEFAARANALIHGPKE